MTTAASTSASAARSATDVEGAMDATGAAADLQPSDFLDADDLFDLTPPKQRRSLMTYVAPLVVFAAVIGVWLFLSEVVLDKDRRFLLPPPQDVVSKGILDSKNLVEI